ncbi:SRPBCC family protein [Phenylobacterium sp.]|uniref:SRPBCC family protein n=1 Tax=Phenylobacterium sp. TaxID=1871053 RepID=UPI0035B39153
MSELAHAFTWTLAASPSAVFAALTEPAALRAWFADEVEIEPRAGGAFRFWGPHVYGAPDREAADGRVTRFGPGRALGFTWTLADAPGEVVLELAQSPEKPDQTQLTGVHRFARTPAIGRAAELVDDLWRIQAGNLMAYLAGGEGIVRVDFTDPKPQVRMEVVIAAPVAAVFKAFVDPELMARWLGAPEPVAETRPGGRYSYGWRYEVDGRTVSGGPTRILEFEENRRLVTDWPDWRETPGVPAQTITWLFDDLGGSTRVTLIHAGFVRPVDISDYPFGWPGFASQLKALFEPAAD